MISGFIVYRWLKLSKWVSLPPACYSSDLAAIFRGFASSLYWYDLLIGTRLHALHTSTHPPHDEPNSLFSWWSTDQNASWNQSVAFCLNTTWPQALMSAPPSNPPRAGIPGLRRGGHIVEGSVIHPGGDTSGGIVNLSGCCYLHKCLSHKITAPLSFNTSPC